MKLKEILLREYALDFRLHYLLHVCRGAHGAGGTLAQRIISRLPSLGIGIEESWEEQSPDHTTTGLHMDVRMGKGT